MPELPYQSVSGDLHGRSGQGCICRERGRRERIPQRQEPSDHRKAGEADGRGGGASGIRRCSDVPRLYRSRKGAVCDTARGDTAQQGYRHRDPCQRNRGDAHGTVFRERRQARRQRVVRDGGVLGRRQQRADCRFYKSALQQTAELSERDPADSASC